jgi:hypothetical protein
MERACARFDNGCIVPSKEGVGIGRHPSFRIGLARTVFVQNVAYL